MPLPDLSLGEWLMIAAASWAILSAVVATPIGRAMRDRQPATAKPMDQPTCRRDPLADQPADCLIGDDLARQFYAVVDTETRWFA